TGSNSKFLSSDIVTEFRGRGDEIRIYPLSFAEFYAAFDGDYDDAWEEYMIYGG
ncbi:AAA family ATPase, partial [Eubacterium sp. CAG:161]